MSAATSEALVASTTDDPFLKHWPRPFYMAGTEGTGEYQVLAASSFGRVGYRLLDSGHVRIRLEPTDRHTSKLAEILSRDLGWKQPGDHNENRFSRVVSKNECGLMRLLLAYRLIKRGRPLQYNPNMPDFESDFAG